MATATQNTLSRSPRATALFAFVPLFLCTNPLDQVSTHLGHILCVLTAELLRFLPSIVLAACQSFGAYAHDHAQSFGCVETLVSVWPVLRFLVG